MANNSSTTHNHQANPPPPTTSPTSMSDIPRVILADILSRLSIRSLSRCRCVCKPWRTLTTDPLFTKMYLSRASSSPPSLLIQAKSPKHGLPCDLYLAEPETCDSNDAVTKINTKFNRSNRQFELVGSINGLLCLSEPLYYDPIYLCNPLIGEYMTLPKPEIDTSFDVVSGFGFDEGSDQYKVIRMVYVTVRDPETRMVSFKLEGEIYSVGSGGGKWRRIGEVPYPLRARASEAYLNGALHWLMTDQDIGIDTSEFIGAFDVSTEEFRPVPPPPAQFCSESRTSARRFKLNLGVLGDKLCIFDNYFSDRVEIWMMNDYGVQSSWTKQFVIKRPRSMVVESGTVYFKPLKLTDNGEILMLFDSVAVVCYDPRTKIFRHLGLFGFHVTTDSITEGIVHVGSLISLRNVAACEGETRGVGADKSIKRQNSDIPYGTWDTILYPVPTHEPKLDIFKWLAERGGVLHVARLDRPSVR